MTYAAATHELEIEFNARLDDHAERWAATAADLRLEALIAQAEMDAEAERWAASPECQAEIARWEAEDAARIDREAADLADSEDIPF